MLSMIAVPLVASSTADAADTDCAQGQACVEVRVVSTTGGKETRLSTSYFTVADLTSGAGIVQNPEYWTRSSAKKAAKPTPRPATALPLRALLQRVTNPPSKPPTFSEVPLRGIPSVLSEDELRAGDDEKQPFLDDLEPSLFAFSSNRIGYIRPQRTEEDLNRSDYFVTGAGGRLVLTFHTTGKLLAPTLSVGATTVNTKTKNAFTVNVPEPGTRISRYRWTFGDGTEYGSRDKARTHRYDKVGTYPVYVQVRGENGSYGRTAPTEMKVGKPPKPPSTTGGGGTGGGGGIGGGGGGGGYIPPYVPTPPSVDNPPSVDTPPTNDLPTTPVDDGLQEVEGFVLAGAGAEQGDSIPGTQASVQPTKASELSTSRKISGAVIGALAVILLLGLGAEIETRWASTRLAHLRRRA
ncbi:hypothetical protein ASE12_16860 [Aeromicrobium sp. Root236]|nr:hypothetical protein ASE12_16860 [Aeromicrobium sp. Root236]